MKNVKKAGLIVFITYLIISSFYILLHINFCNEPEIVGMGYSETTNVIRMLMGLPKTYSTYTGVSPLFLIEIFIKLVITIVLIKILKDIRWGKNDFRE